RRPARSDERRDRRSQRDGIPGCSAADQLTSGDTAMKSITAAVVAVIAFSVGTTQVVLRAQNPSLRWVKAAPFPEPEEELYGVSVNGKMYVIGGFASNGKPAAAMVYEYDPGPVKWTKKKSIPLPVHHQSKTVLNCKMYIFYGYNLRQLTHGAR